MAYLRVKDVAVHPKYKKKKSCQSRRFSIF